MQEQQLNCTQTTQSDASAVVRVNKVTTTFKPLTPGKHGTDITSGVKSKWLRKPKSRKPKNAEHSVQVAQQKTQHALKLTRRVPITAGKHVCF
jgi:hypothetical protein